jgi:hypothetical protein
MIMRRILTFVALFAAPSVVVGQTCQTAAAPANCTLATLASPATLTNPKTIQLAVSTTTTAATTTIADFDNSYISVTGPVVTVNANQAWTLLLSAAAATWTNVGTGSRANKPATDLKWATSAGGSFVSFSTTPTSFASGPATNSTVTSLFYRGVLDWTLDKPGVYTLGVTLTITTP